MITPDDGRISITVAPCLPYDKRVCVYFAGSLGIDFSPYLHSHVKHSNGLLIDIFSSFCSQDEKEAKKPPPSESQFGPRQKTQKLSRKEVLLMSRSQ